MRILITGLNGRLAPHLAAEAKAADWHVLPWPREIVDPEDSGESALFLQRMRPDAIAHLAMGTESWAAQLAAYARLAHIPFLFTSSAMVFHHEPDGPHDIAQTPNAEDDYGRYKMRCEQAIWQANPHACMARIGWQIDGEARGNNMLAALDGWQRDQGRVAASRLWTPACSFMSDTAHALWQLLQERASGLYHLDSNAVEAWRFDELVLALARQFERPWQLEVTEAYRHDQRLLGHAERMPGLSQRLARP
jgi:dTDP-4-dehydrorhamnose reductase